MESVAKRDLKKKKNLSYQNPKRKKWEQNFLIIKFKFTKKRFIFANTKKITFHKVVFRSFIFLLLLIAQFYLINFFFFLENIYFISKKKEENTTHRVLFI
jgi:hypothetical protein